MIRPDGGIGVGVGKGVVVDKGVSVGIGVEVARDIAFPPHDERAKQNANIKIKRGEILVYHDLLLLQIKPFLRRETAGKMTDHTFIRTYLLKMRLHLYLAEDSRCSLHFKQSRSDRLRTILTYGQFTAWLAVHPVPLSSSVILVGTGTPVSNRFQVMLPSTCP